MAREPEAEHLLRKRDWLEIQAVRRLKRRPYQRLDPNHPDFDVEDLPHVWQRVIAHTVGVLVIAAVLGAAWYLSRPLGPALPAALDWLSARF